MSLDYSNCVITCIEKQAILFFSGADTTYYYKYYYNNDKLCTIQTETVKSIPFDDITVSSAFNIEKLMMIKFVSLVIFAPSPLIFTLMTLSFSFSSDSI